MQKLNYKNTYSVSHFERRYKQEAPIDAKEKFLELQKRNSFRTRRKPKTVNLAAVFTLCVVFLASFAVNKQNFLDPVYFNRIKNSNLNFSTDNIYAPTLNYASNLNLFGQNLRSGVQQKGREKLVTIHSTGDIPYLRKQIEDVLSQYPKLHAGVYIYDYKTEKTVQINSDEVFPAASIIKIPVLLDLFNHSKSLQKEGFEGIDVNKKLTFTEADRAEGSGYLQYKQAGSEYSIDYLAKIMIRQSDNSATNMLIQYNGGINQVNASLRHWGFSKTQISEFLPDLNGYNKTTPQDIATMLYNIDNQSFLPIKYSAYIKDYMSKVENRTLIRSQVPNDAVLIHKTGDIGTMLGDAGVIYSPDGNKYIMSIMVKRPHNDYSARDLIQKVSKAVWESLGK